MRSILADKQARGLIKVIDAFPETRFSTKEYVSLLTNLKLQDQKVLIVSTNPSLKLTKSCANLSRVEVVQPAALNPLGLMKHPTMLISLSAFKVLETIY